MIKTKKNKYVAMIIIISLIICILSSVSYGASYTVSPSSATLSPGETVTITVNITGATGTFNVTSSSNVTISKSQIWVEPGTTDSITVTTKSEGTATITFTPAKVWTSDVEPVNVTDSIGTKTATITVKTPTPVNNNTTGGGDTSKPTNSTTGSTTNNSAKSTNNYLKSLSIEGVDLSPSFNKSTISYSANVGEETSSIKVSATAEDSKATVTGTGNISLKDGENSVKITVTSESGSVRTYTINVVKQEKVLAPLGVKTIDINGTTDDGQYEQIDLSPLFDTNIKKYTCTINSKIKRLIIESELNDENMTMEVLGATDLVEGENLITILVRRADSDEIVTYEIIAIKEASTKDEIISSSETTKTDYIEKYGMLIAIVAACLAILGIIFGIVEYSYGKKHSQKREYRNPDIEDKDNIDDVNEDIEEKEFSIEKKLSKKGRHF